MHSSSAATETFNAKIDLEREIRRDRRASLIVNTRSRKGRDLFEAAKAGLQARGVAIERCMAADDPGSMPGIVGNWIAAGARWVIVGGGDGTISSVVDAFARRDVVFGLLPLGTANSFARTVSIPMDLEGAIDVLLTGKVVDVDLGRINGDYFANGAALGISAAIGQARPATLKRWLGPAAYVLVAGRELVRHKPFKCRLTFGGATRSFDALEVRIANGTHHGGMLVSPEASVESHDLVVYVIKGTSRIAFLRAWADMALGRARQGSAIEVVRAGEISIETDPPQAVSIDGEVMGSTPIKASVARQSLHLIVPAERRDLR